MYLYLYKESLYLYKGIIQAKEMAHWLSELVLLFQRPQVQFLALTPGSSQLPVAPAPEDLTQSSGQSHACVYIYTHTYAYLLQNKS